MSNCGAHTFNPKPQRRRNPQTLLQLSTLQHTALCEPLRQAGHARPSNQRTAREGPPANAISAEDPNAARNAPQGALSKIYRRAHKTIRRRGSPATLVPFKVTAPPNRFKWLARRFQHREEGRCPRPGAAEAQDQERHDRSPAAFLPPRGMAAQRKPHLG